MSRSPLSRSLALLAALAVAALAAGCDRSGAPPGLASASRPARLEVVAAENSWGSIAAQLAGTRADVHSIVVDPGTDPHTYQPTAADARALADCNMAIVNGLGYDPWASQELAASPSPGRAVLDVGRMLGLAQGANPHRWYFPADVHSVIGAISADLQRLDPAGAAYFAARRQMLEAGSLARYDALRRELRARYGGVPIGYSESIFQGLGEDLGLKLLTPYSFVKAIAEGTDVTAQDKQTVNAQAQQGRIAVWVFNGQNVTPDVQRVNEIARSRGIPVATVSETPTPRGASFEAWQDRQLEGLAAALHAATGR